jgi:hypothetical protein
VCVCVCVYAFMHAHAHALNASSNKELTRKPAKKKLKKLGGKLKTTGS